MGGGGLHFITVIWGASHEISSYGKQPVTTETLWGQTVSGLKGSKGHKKATGLEEPSSSHISFQMCHRGTIELKVNIQQLHKTPPKHFSFWIKELSSPTKALNIFLSHNPGLFPTAVQCNDMRASYLLLLLLLLWRGEASSFHHQKRRQVAPENLTVPWCQTSEIRLGYLLCSAE